MMVNPPPIVRRRLSLASLALLVLLALMAVVAPRETLQAWYAATLLWTGISLGAMAVLMIHHLTSGAWGWYLRPLLCAAVDTLPLALLAYLPLLAAMDVLFPWTRPEHTLPEVVRNKLAYLNVPFFVARAALYAAIWLGMARLLLAAEQGRHDRRRGLAAAGLILYALTITFYGVDWVQSLEPTFYSSAIGYVMATGQFAGALAFCIAMAILLRDPRTQPEAPPFNDLGNLLLAAVLLWTYIVFAKFLIIWIADLPHEIEWYVHRQAGAWYHVTPVLIALHFCLPLMLLLFRRVKGNPSLLAGVAGLLLVAHVLDIFWLVLPSFGSSLSYAGFVHVLAVVALGLAWLAVFFSRLSTHQRENGSDRSGVAGQPLAGRPP